MSCFATQNPRALGADTVQATVAMRFAADPVVSSRAVVFSGVRQARNAHVTCDLAWCHDGFGGLDTQIIAEDKLERGSPAPREAERSSGRRP